MWSVKLCGVDVWVDMVDVEMCDVCVVVVRVMCVV